MADLTEHIRENVRQRYAAAARQVAEQNGEGCCGSETGCGSAVQAEKADFFGGSLYDRADTEGVPETAVSASLGCGVPTAVADLHEGEIVLDLGSGAGADVLISARLTEW